MYSIKLTKRGNKINIRHVSRSIVLKKRLQTIKLAHVGKPGVPGKPGGQGVPGVGLPTGGTTGQLVAKASNDNYDYTFLSVNDIGDKHVSQEFSVSDLVIVTHNLSKYPAVNVIDSAGDEVEGEVYYPSQSQVIVRFTNPFSGRITCN